MSEVTVILSLMGVAFSAVVYGQAAICLLNGWRKLDTYFFVLLNILLAIYFSGVFALVKYRVI